MMVTVRILVFLKNGADTYAEENVRSNSNLYNIAIFISVSSALPGICFSFTGAAVG